MTEFPSNSYADRSTATPRPAEPAVERVKAEPLPLQGHVVRQKKPLGKRFAETFFGGHVQGVGGYLVMEILLPAARDLVYEMMLGGAERMLYPDMGGRPGGRRSPLTRPPGGPTASRFNYNGVTRDARREDPRGEISRSARREHQFESLGFDNLVDATEALENLRGYIERYQSATVADLYNLCHITPEFTDEKYGWKDLRDAGVRRYRGSYILELPRPVLLD